MESPKIDAGKTFVIFGQSITALGCLLIILVPVCLIGLCLALGFFAGEPTLITADDYVKEYGGSAELYRYILTLNDCSLLQDQFDLANASNEKQTAGTSPFKMTTGYMKASDDRMKAIGCDNATHSDPSSQPVVQPLATVTLLVSVTPFVLPTLTKPANAVIYLSPTPIDTFIYVVPTQPTDTVPMKTNCSCAADTLNCENFSDWFDAQSCMDKCVNMGKGDIYRLDADNDGIACESLP